MRINKKGFTLVELLAVIVILAVVMLIAVTAVGPLMTKSRKGALGTEGIKLVDAAKTAYQTEQLSNSSAIKATSTVCFDLEWLYQKGYFEKGSDNNYSGSVLVTYNNGKYDYNFWIGNATYSFNGVAPDGYDIDNTTQVTDADTSSSNCNSGTVDVTCTYDATNGARCV